MTRIDGSILGSRYVFWGVKKEIVDEIVNQAKKEQFQENFSKWAEWQQSVIGNDAIVVCDPYGMLKGSSTSMSKDNYTEKAREAAAALADQLEGSAAYQKVSWENSILQMFSKRYCESGKIYGMQWNDGTLVNTSVGSVVAILFIDFQLVGEREKGLWLPTLLHEATHFLEDQALHGGCFGEKEILGSRIKDSRLWGPNTEGNLCGVLKWAKLFAEMADYQSENAEERLTTLVEKMAVGSLHEEEGQGWVEALKETFCAVLKEGIGI